MIARPVIARGAASVILAGALLLGTAGCGFVTEQATLIQYDPSDGVSAEVGNVKVLNLLAFSSDGRDVALAFTAVNSGKSSKTVTLQIDVNGKKIDKTFTIDGLGSTSIGGEGSTIVFTDANITVGDLLPVYVQYGSEQGELALVPVLDGSIEMYSDLLPPERDAK